ncbi:conserved Plasmodium protein, unknown function [Plasmodium relictum]|uniref:RRM domain-containing protein n=1 Tax=Plasmodium relictum TaxID=85471 RepID=A0A1J1H6C0_PLARL|nr:conserved Plasmodium protein, unknown function [Plasmodium relictum]CRG99146.1 conserved Plasmodium protein, unknown function [Plasmodium relictum]
MVDNSDINMFFVSNLPFEVTENELKEFFSPKAELIYCKLRKVEIGIKSSHGYLGFKNGKEDILSYVENNKFRNKEISIELIEDENDSEYENENYKHDSEHYNEKCRDLDSYKNVHKNKDNEVYKKTHKHNNKKLNKNIEIINENGEITKFGFLILKNMNMYDIVLLIKKIQELVRLSPQTAIKMLNENKTIYYSLVHALFLLGILNIEINPLSNEEIEKSNFYKIKSRFQYIYMDKKEEEIEGKEEVEEDNNEEETEEMEEKGIDTISSFDNKEKKKKKKNYELNENSETDIFLNGKKRKINDEYNESIGMNYNFSTCKKNCDTYNNMQNMKFNSSKNNEKSGGLINNRNISRSNHPNSKNMNYYGKNLFSFNNLNKNVKRDDYKQNYKKNENSANENNPDTNKKKNYLNKSYYTTTNSNNNNTSLTADKKKVNPFMNKISKNKNMNCKNMKTVSFSSNIYNTKSSNNSFKNSNRIIDNTNEKNLKLLYSYKNKDFVQNKFKNKNVNFNKEDNFINKNNIYINNYKEDNDYEFNNGDGNLSDRLKNFDSINISKINENDKNSNYYNFSSSDNSYSSKFNGSDQNSNYYNNFNNIDNQNISKINENNKNNFYRSEYEKVNKGAKGVKPSNRQNNYENSSSNLSDCSINIRNKKSYISDNKNVNEKKYMYPLYNKEGIDKISNEKDMENTNKINKEVDRNNSKSIKNENNNDYINWSLEANKKNEPYESPQNLYLNDKNVNNDDANNLKNNDDNNILYSYNNSNYNSDNNFNNDDNKNINNASDKNLEYGKKLMQRIKSNNQRRCIKLIDRKNNEDLNEEKMIKVKNINISNVKNDSLNRKHKREDNINMHLKMLLNKLKISLNNIPNADEDLLNEIINQKSILQNIIVSKYTDMLNWPNEQILRVLSIRKSLKNKGYNINEII